MRPPRPWPSWRRARSRSMSSGRSSRPAGRPSSTAVRPGPCDSPAVVKRSATAPTPYWRESALLVDQRGQEVEGARRLLLEPRGAGRVGLAHLLLAGKERRRRDLVDLQELEVELGAAVLVGEEVLVLVLVRLQVDEGAGVHAGLAGALAGLLER